MKKIFATVLVLGLSWSSNLYAAEYPPQMDSCTEKYSEKYSYTGFYRGKGCTGGEESLFFIKNGDEYNKVTESKWNSSLAAYKEDGPICESEETISPVPALQAKCVKGQYGEYYSENKKISYEKFQSILLGKALSQAQSSLIEQAKKDAQEYLLKIEDLEDYKVLIKNKSKLSDKNMFEQVDLEFKEYIGADGCTDGKQKLLVNGNGSEYVCEGGKIKEIKYFILGKDAKEEVYLINRWARTVNTLKEMLKSTSTEATAQVSVVSTGSNGSAVCTRLSNIKSLSKGASGDSVLALQKFLNSKGYLSKVPSSKKYGPSTVAAVKKYQKDKKIKVSGSVGSATLSKMRKECN